MSERAPSRDVAAHATSSAQRASTRGVLLLFVLLNALFQALIYVIHDGRLTFSLSPSPTGEMRFLFAAYVVAGVLTLSGVLYLFALGIDRLVPRRDLRGWGPWFLIVIEGLIFFALSLDARNYEIMGVHLFSPIAAKTLTNADVQREMQIPIGTVLGILALGIGSFAAEPFIYRWCLKRGELPPFQSSNGRRWIQLAALGTILLTVGIVMGTRPRIPGEQRQYVRALPFASQLLGESSPFLEVMACHYPPETREKPVVLEQKKDVVLLTIETLRALDFGPEFTPELHALANRPECVVSDQHFSGGHTTEFGVFSLLYGVHAFHYAPFQTRSIPSVPLTALRDNGFRLEGAASSQLREWNKGAFMLENFDEYQEFVDVPSDEGDRQVLEWLKTTFHAEHTGPRFLFAFMDSTHHNYLYPPEFERFTPVIPPDYDHFIGDERLAPHHQKIHNRYKNALGYVDSLVGELVASIEERLTRGEVILVVTGDHGEEFWEHGFLGHGAPVFHNERIQVPFILCGAGSPESIPLSGHVDMFPTLFSLLGANRIPGKQDGMNGSTLTAALPDDHLLLINGLDFPWGARLAVAIGGDLKVHMELCPGEIPCLRAWNITDRQDQSLHEPPPLAHTLVQWSVSELQRWLTIQPVRGLLSK